MRNEPPRSNRSTCCGAIAAQPLRRLPRNQKGRTTPRAVSSQLGAVMASSASAIAASDADLVVRPIRSPFTYPFNVTQQPAASVPCGFTRDGLPIGLQFVGPMRADLAVLQAARAFETARPFATIDAPRA